MEKKSKWSDRVKWVTKGIENLKLSVSVDSELDTCPPVKIKGKFVWKYNRRRGIFGLEV